MNTTSRNLCIIPARGGSKRIPRKNIKCFLGKPIIAYSIELAKSSGMFDEIIVSTDDIEIASVSKDFGAQVPFLRSSRTADDFATLSDVVEEAKAFYQNKERRFDNICCILATAPFITRNLLVESYQLLKEGGFDSVRPVVKFSYPIQRALRVRDNRATMFDSDMYSVRSQDLEQAYHDAGLFYWMDYSKGLGGENKGAIEVSERNAQDIDTPEDWEFAELKYRLLKNGI